MAWFPPKLTKILFYGKTLANLGYQFRRRYGSDENQDSSFPFSLEKQIWDFLSRTNYYFIRDNLKFMNLSK